MRASFLALIFIYLINLVQLFHFEEIAETIVFNFCYIFLFISYRDEVSAVWHCFIIQMKNFFMNNSIPSKSSDL